MRVTAKRPTGTLSSPKCRFLLFLLSKVLCKACVKGEGSWRSFPEVLKARGVNMPCATSGVRSPYFLVFLISCLIWADLSSWLRLFNTIGLKNRISKKSRYIPVSRSLLHTCPYFLNYSFSCLMWADLSSWLRLFDTIGLKIRVSKKIPVSRSRSHTRPDERVGGLEREVPSPSGNEGSLEPDATAYLGQLLSLTSLWYMRANHPLMHMAKLGLSVAGAHRLTSHI